MLRRHVLPFREPTRICSTCGARTDFSSASNAAVEPSLSRIDFSTFSAAACTAADADIAGHTLQGVREPSGQFAVACLERLADFDIRIALFLHKLVQQTPVQSLISSDTPQAAGDIDALDCGEFGSAAFGGGAAFSAGAGSSLAAWSTGRGGEKRIRVDRLGDVVVHPGLQTALALFHKCMRSHRDDGKIDESAGRPAATRVAVKPSISGICRSIRTMSKAVAAALPEGVSPQFRHGWQP